jgi:hypothetical protein
MNAMRRPLRQIDYLEHIQIRAQLEQQRQGNADRSNGFEP